MFDWWPFMGYKLIMEDNTTRFNFEQPNINNDELDGFDFRPADDDEFSDLLPEPIGSTEIPAGSSNQEVRDIYDESLESFFERLEEIKDFIDDDDSAEIWRELVRRAQASTDLGDNTDSAGLIQNLNHLEECYNHLVSDIIYHNQAGQA